MGEPSHCQKFHGLRTYQKPLIDSFWAELMSHILTSKRPTQSISHQENEKNRTTSCDADERGLCKLEAAGFKSRPIPISS